MHQSLKILESGGGNESEHLLDQVSFWALGWRTLQIGFHLQFE